MSCIQDGRVCWFDMRSKDVLYTMDVAQNPISSLCFKQGLIIYVSFLVVSCFLSLHNKIFYEIPYLIIRISIFITDLLVKSIESLESFWLLLIVVSRDSGNEDILYVSSENEVKVFDVHMVIPLLYTFYISFS